MSTRTLYAAKTMTRPYGGMSSSAGEPRIAQQQNFNQVNFNDDQRHRRAPQAEQYTTGVKDRKPRRALTLVGEFDFQVEYASGVAQLDAVPSISTAIREQIGLRLEAKKGNVEAVVVDHAEKPSEN
jgi:uncharacterized protein (TIGR03435 family)